MLTVREKFYKENILKFINDKNASVLVCGAEDDDKKIFELCGFKNVTISNINNELDGDTWKPYKFSYQNAESMTCADNSYDYVVIHEAIHHASSPHKILTEMYRVAKIGVLASESRDSFIMRFLVKLNLTQDYEYSGVYHNNFKGGVNNTEIPNFIYRWTEREIEKTIKSYAPFAKHEFKYNYGTRFPFLVKYEKNGLIKYSILKIIQPLYFLFTKVFFRQQNLFAFFIKKPIIPDDLFQWIQFDNAHNKLSFNKEWGHIHFGKKK